MELDIEQISRILRCNYIKNYVEGNIRREGRFQIVGNLGESFLQEKDEPVKTIILYVAVLDILYSDFETGLDPDSGIQYLMQGEDETLVSVWFSYYSSNQDENW